eukprot:7061329-Prymnesium_polylepis.1
MGPLDGTGRSASGFETCRASYLASRARDAVGRRSPAPPWAWAWPSSLTPGQAKLVVAPDLAAAEV